MYLKRRLHKPLFFGHLSDIDWFRKCRKLRFFCLSFLKILEFSKKMLEFLGKISKSVGIFWQKQKSFDDFKSIGKNGKFINDLFSAHLVTREGGLMS